MNQGKAFFSPAISKMLVEDYLRQMRDRGVEDRHHGLWGHGWWTGGLRGKLRRRGGRCER